MVSEHDAAAKRTAEEAKAEKEAMRRMYDKQLETLREQYETGQVRVAAIHYRYNPGVTPLGGCCSHPLPCVTPWWVSQRCLIMQGRQDRAVDRCSCICPVN